MFNICEHCNNGYCFDCGYVFEALSHQEQLTLEITALQALCSAQYALTNRLLTDGTLALIESSFMCEDTLHTMLNSACFDLMFINTAQRQGF